MIVINIQFENVKHILQMYEQQGTPLHASITTYHISYINILYFTLIFL